MFFILEPGIDETLAFKQLIAIGSTGSGKSVLINTLVGKKLIVKTNPFDIEKVAIDLADGESGLKIGHN